MDKQSLNITSGIETVVHNYLKNNLKVKTRVSTERLFEGCWTESLITEVYLGDERISKNEMSLDHNW